jgi:hypothetical protein
MTPKIQKKLQQKFGILASLASLSAIYCNYYKELSDDAKR